MRLLSPLVLWSSGLSTFALGDIVKYGTIGMGINMYKPVCAYSCHDSMASLYLNCTVFGDHTDMQGMEMKLRKRMDMGGHSMGTTSDDCYASDSVWLKTLSNCFNQQCSADGLSEAVIEEAWARLAANGVPLPSLKSSLPSIVPTEELASDAEWLNTTMLVNQDIYSTNYRTLAEFEYQENMHVRLSILVIVLTVAAFLLAKWFRAAKTSRFGRFFPAALSERIILPAVLNGRHLEPLPLSMGYAPSRILSLNIFIYIFLNLLVCCVPYKSMQPTTWFSDSRSEIATYVANRTGVLSFANIALSILFVGRNNPIILLTGFDQTTTLTFHRWAARVATVQAVVHSIIYTATYFWSGGAAAYYAEAALPYYWWGIIGTLALCLAITFAVLPIRKRRYELFVVVHVVLVAIALIGCWYHIDLRFTKKWGYEVWLYLAMAFWGFERLSRWFIFVWRNMTGSTTQAVAEVVPGSKLIKLTVQPGRAWDARAGQHAFLYFPSTGRLWESHPFSIATWDNGIDAAHEVASSSNSIAIEDKEMSGKEAMTTTTTTTVAPVDRKTPRKPTITFLFRAHNGITRSFSDSLAGRPCAYVSVNLEGPYGRPINLNNADTILLIGGGIGVTALLSYIQAFIERNRSASTAVRRQRLILAWNYREPELGHVVRSMIQVGAEHMGLELRIRCTTSESRLSVHEAVQNASSDLRRDQRLAVVVCGPGSMADEARRTVVAIAGQGPIVDYHEEAFTW